jgi:hypothetical protein
MQETGAPEGIRTPDPQIRSLVLYPAELPAPWEKAGVLPEGSEPPHQRCICSAAVSLVKRPRAASL